MLYLSRPALRLAVRLFSVPVGSSAAGTNATSKAGWTDFRLRLEADVRALNDGRCSRIYELRG